MNTLKSTYSLYEIAKLINKEFKALGLKVIPTQQMYNYSKNGLIDTVDVDDVDAEGNPKIVQRVEIEVGDAFIAKFVARRVERVSNDS